jgi:GMP synthase-like glutamine amidotransferase
MHTVHVLQHVPMEGAGRIAQLAREMGMAVVEHRLFEKAPPDAIASGDVLVSMGGPMGVSDIGDPRWPFLPREVRLLERSLREGRATIGVCLGAQLMAHALGARVYPLHAGDPPARLREVGWGAVTFVPPSGAEPVLAGMQRSEVVVHWHGDTFDLPPEAVLLASTLLCPNQMFRFGRSAFALQFHVELTPAEVAEWVLEDAAFVTAANGLDGGKRIRADIDRYAASYRAMGDRMIRNMLAIALESGA